MPDNIKINDKYMISIYHPLAYTINKNPVNKTDKNNRQVQIYTLFSEIVGESIEIKVYNKFDKTIDDYIKKAKSENAVKYEFINYSQNIEDTKNASLFWQIGEIGNDMFNRYYFIKIIKADDFTVVVELKGNPFALNIFEENKKIITHMGLRITEK